MSDHTLTFITITDAMYVFDVAHVNNVVEFIFEVPDEDNTKFFFEGNSFVCVRRIGALKSTITYEIHGSIFPFEDGEVSNMVSIVENLTTKNRIK